MPAPPTVPQSAVPAVGFAGVVGAMTGRAFPGMAHEKSVWVKLSKHAPATHTLPVKSIGFA